MHKGRNRLLALLAANSSKPKRFEVVRNEATPDEASIYLYDVIDPFWGVSAKQFVKELNGLTAPVIHLHINSPGGDVFDGRAMAAAISAHKSKVVAHVDGLAASAASYVAIAAGEVIMAEGSFMMIHNAWTIAFGNKDDLIATAGILEKIDESLVDTYVAKTGATKDQVKEWMNAETWFTAQEAVDEGFASSVAEGGQSTKNAWDLTMYDRARPKDEPAPDPDTELLEAEHASRLRRAALLTNFA